MSRTGGFPRAVDRAGTAPRRPRMRLGEWPADAGIGHLVILEHDAVPSPGELQSWIERARRRGFRALRTGALFPAATRVAREVGFEPIDTLVLLHLDLAEVDRGELERAATWRTSRLWARQHAAAAAVDRAAFGDPWANTARSLAEIRRATPAHRARRAGGSREVGAFAISGAGGRTGYVQRLAVHPDRRRRGLGAALVADSIDWMLSRRLDAALVNTGADNVAALALYERFGFHRLPDRLTVAELSLGHTT